MLLRHPGMLMVKNFSQVTGIVGSRFASGTTPKVTARLVSLQFRLWDI